MNKILFISVHPDDETLGCGGTILKHKEIGDELFWLIISAPTDCHPSGFSSEMIKTREKEILAVSKQYGFSNTITLGFPAQLLYEVGFNKLVSKIDESISKLEPEIIFLINRSDVHSDHRISFEAIYACTKSFRKPYIKKILMYETLSETEFAPALVETAFCPNFFVDVSKYFKKKIDIMEIYKSELMSNNLPRSISAIEALARYRGSRIGVKYAEAFMLLFEKH